MPQTFSRTLRSLEADRATRASMALLAAAVLLVGWIAWAFLARVPVVALSERARLEVERSAHPVQAGLGARLLAVEVVLGQRVEVGAALFTFEKATLEARIAEERQRLGALEEERSALLGERDSTLERRGLASEVARSRTAEAEARFREARAAAELAAAELERLKRLEEEGLASRADVERSRSLLTQRRAAAEVLELAVGREEDELRALDREIGERLDRLRQQLARNTEQQAGARGLLETLGLEIAEHTLRSPVTGRIAQLAEVAPGAMVGAGQRLAVVVPEGAPRVVACFAPGEALGRVRAGQRASVRLTGFPSMRYGRLEARVTTLGSEVSEGCVRVELALEDGETELPLEHGLPGQVEVELERVSPAALLLRAAGGALDGAGAG
jgi:membrane fusion protein (multidrug efflux system)